MKWTNAEPRAGAGRIVTYMVVLSAFAAALLAAYAGGGSVDGRNFAVVPAPPPTTTDFVSGRLKWLPEEAPTLEAVAEPEAGVPLAEPHPYP